MKVSELFSLTQSAGKSVRKLPCYPCPHQSACCMWGVDLTADEAVSIIENHGVEAVRSTPDGYRTAVTDKGCVFLKDNGCTIHGTDYYPETCVGFPFHGGLSAENYEGDQTICPEFTGG